MTRQHSGLQNNKMLYVYGADLEKVRWWFVEALMVIEDFQLDSCKR